MTITKEDIAEQLQQKLGFSKPVCKEIVTIVFDEAVRLAARDHKLTLQNFGTFRVHRKPARPGFNINTKTPVTIQPRQVLSFIACTALKKAVNKAKSAKLIDDQDNKS